MTRNISQVISCLDNIPSPKIWYLFMHNLIGSKLREAYRNWRYKVDRKLKGTKRTGNGRIKLSQVEMAIYEMESSHGKRYDRTIMVL